MGDVFTPQAALKSYESFHPRPKFAACGVHENPSPVFLHRISIRPRLTRSSANRPSCSANPNPSPLSPKTPSTAAIDTRNPWSSHRRETESLPHGPAQLSVIVPHATPAWHDQTRPTPGSLPHKKSAMQYHPTRATHHHSNSRYAQSESPEPISDKPQQNDATCSRQPTGAKPGSPCRSPSRDRSISSGNAFA